MQPFRTERVEDTDGSAETRYDETDLHYPRDQEERHGPRQLQIELIRYPSILILTLVYQVVSAVICSNVSYYK